jgi:hypothetical protein
MFRQRHARNREEAVGDLINPLTARMHPLVLAAAGMRERETTLYRHLLSSLLREKIDV